MIGFVTWYKKGGQVHFPKDEYAHRESLLNPWHGLRLCHGPPPKHVVAQTYNARGAFFIHQSRVKPWWILLVWNS